MFFGLPQLQGSGKASESAVVAAPLAAAFSLVQQARQRGLRPNFITYSALLAVCQKVPSLSKSLNLAISLYRPLNCSLSLSIAYAHTTWIGQSFIKETQA